ncbi:MAG TPA: transcriptional repressor [Elusimicrobiota bacterium]|nr:transcriptional repressor [Elusimicrobiota bacterium]
MNDHLKAFRNYLKEQGLKNTSQREEILAFLGRSSRHLSPEEIFRELRRRDPRLGRATVFRTLRLLGDCGLATRVTFPDGKQKFETRLGGHHHDHMLCVHCGRAIEFVSPAVEEAQKRLARRYGFKVLWHRHEIFGRCRRCETAGPSPRRS